MSGGLGGWSELWKSREGCAGEEMFHETLIIKFLKLSIQQNDQVMTGKEYHLWPNKFNWCIYMYMQ